MRLYKQRGRIPDRFDQQNDLQAGKKEMENIKYLRRLYHEAKTMKET